MMDRAERVHLRALCEAATPGPECTGISSRWCPRCGDCTCPGDPDRGDPMDDPRCPLHAASSPHGEDEEHSPDTAALLRLGDEARTALPALLDDSERLATAARERDEARAEVERLRATVDTMQAQLDAHREWLATAQASGDEARAEAERLRRRTGALEHAVMMADSLDGEVSFDDIECPFCDEVWRDDGHALACPRHMGDVIRRERAAGDGVP